MIAGTARHERGLAWLWAADLWSCARATKDRRLVVAEAMSVGLPVVATAVDGVPER